MPEPYRPGGVFLEVNGVYDGEDKDDAGSKANDYKFQKDFHFFE
jgi:hypothetical protein